MSDAVGERRLTFDGVQNFRDVGGYPVAGGGSTRWGLVYRSDRLDKMTDDDLARFDELGIRRVYDLRNDHEREVAPDRVANEHVSIMSGIEARGGKLDPIDGITEHRQGEQALRNLYDGMLAHSGPDIGRILNDLASDDHLPAVIHCTAGKDRTGVVVALLLELLGVDRDTILDDYELTNRYRTVEHQADTFERLAADGVAPEAAAAMLDAPRWAMGEMLTDLDRVFGGIDVYVRERALVDDAAVIALRAKLIER